MPFVAQDYASEHDLQLPQFYLEEICNIVVLLETETNKRWDRPSLTRSDHIGTS